MTRTRLEAFSDGVLAIIITIMVLELKVPQGHHWKDVVPVLPHFQAYLFSFVFVAVYWVNHHHLVHTIHRVSWPILWANIHLLFWLSLIPFATAWMGESHFEGAPVMLYSILMILCGFAYQLLQRSIVQTLSADSPFLISIKKEQWKGIASLIGYSVAALFSLRLPVISEIIFVAIAVIWVIPNRNIEHGAASH